MTTENQNPQPQEGQGTGSAQEKQNISSSYNELLTKKGFKDNESFAKSYTELESTYGKTQNALNKAKENIESQTQGLYTLDKDGNLQQTEKAQSHYQPQYQQPYQQQYQQPENQTPVYDPYTGQQITDPMQLKLAQMPIGMREAVITNAILEQREKFQQSAFKNEGEVLSSQDAKGFEDDVRKVMMSLPLAQRANKKSWEDALLRVKGMRYDQDRQKWNQEGVENLLEKQNVQDFGGSAQVPISGGAKLGAEEEQIYQYWHKKDPQKFPDRKTFMKVNSPTGGR